MIIEVRPNEYSERTISLSSNSVKVLRFFMNHKNCYYNVNYLAQSCNIHVRDIHACLISLAKLGLVSRNEQHFWHFIEPKEKITFRKAE